jgi:hypothetical protein
MAFARCQLMRLKPQAHPLREGKPGFDMRCNALKWSSNALTTRADMWYALSVSNAL